MITEKFGSTKCRSGLCGKNEQHLSGKPSRINAPACDLFAPIPSVFRCDCERIDSFVDAAVRFGLCLRRNRCRR